MKLDHLSEQCKHNLKSMQSPSNYSKATIEINYEVLLS